MTAAIVTNVLNPTPPGNRRMWVVDFTFSTSYPTNGEPMTPAVLGGQAVDCVIPMGPVRASAAVYAVYDRAHTSLRLLTTSTGAEVTGASDQSSNLVTLLVIGE